MHTHAPPKRPRLDLRRLWWWILLSTFIGLCSAEYAARRAGHRPSPRDDTWLWSQSRAALQRAQRSHISIVGASRAAYGIDSHTLAALYPEVEVFQLSIRSGGVGRVLEELADSPPPVAGRVLVSIAGPSLEQFHSGVSLQYVHGWRNEWRPALDWDRSLRTFLQSRLAIYRHEVDPRTILHQLSRGRGWPQPNPIATDAQRNVIAPKSALRARITGPRGRTWVEQYAANRSRHQVTLSTWNSRIARIMNCVDRLRTSGTQVIFVRMPSSGPLLALEEIHYPRRQYWRALELACNGDRCTTIHFEDHPGLKIDPPDYSHLSADQRTQFTGNLMTLVEAGISATGTDTVAANDGPDHEVWSTFGMLHSPAIRVGEAENPRQAPRSPVDLAPDDPGPASLRLHPMVPQ